MVWILEDWSKTGKRFTEADLAKIRAGYFAGTIAKQVAQELNCCTRTIQKYFSRFKSEFGPVKRQRKPRSRNTETPRFDPVAAREKRFYRGSFDL